MAGNEAALRHFIELARAGVRRSASGGEQRCYRLAQQLLDDAGGIDQQAFDGLVEFAKVANASWTTAKDLLKNGK